MSAQIRDVDFSPAPCPHRDMLPLCLTLLISLLHGKMNLARSRFAFHIRSAIGA